MENSELIKNIKDEMANLINNDDYETAHSTADDLLCSLLNALGYEDVVNLYHNVGKWYA